MNTIEIYEYVIRMKLDVRQTIQLAYEEGVEQGEREAYDEELKGL